MGINLQLLGLQAIPRLAKKFDVELDGFSGFIDLYGTSPEEFRKAYEKCGKILKYLFKEFNVSWWDVYSNSDIGMERMGLARDMGLEKSDIVLDVGCGRAYFTIAATTCSRRVIGLDAVNGMSRQGVANQFGNRVYMIDFEKAVKQTRIWNPLKGFEEDTMTLTHSCIAETNNKTITLV